MKSLIRIFHARSSRRRKEIQSRFSVEHSLAGSILAISYVLRIYVLAASTSRQLPRFNF